MTSSYPEAFLHSRHLVKFRGNYTLHMKYGRDLQGHRQDFPHKHVGVWRDTWQGFPPGLVGVWRDTGRFPTRLVGVCRDTGRFPTQGVVRGCWRSNERYPTPPLSFLSLPGPVGNTYKTRTMSKQSQTSEEPSGKAIFCHASWQSQGQDTGLHLNS